jgi:hypothetical protein
MKAKTTFTDAAWDFEKIWNIDSQINDGYPILKQQFVGIIDLQAIVGGVLISPNPAFNYINLNLTENNSQINSIMIYNDYGQIVLVPSSNSQVGDKNNFSINIESLPTGTYTLVLQSNSNRFMKRFVVVK